MKKTATWITLLAPVFSCLAGDSLPVMEKDTPLKGVTGTDTKPAIAQYLKQNGWSGEEVEYEILLDYLNSHVRQKEGQWMWSAKYQTFGRENLEGLNKVRKALAGKPDSYINDWVAWYAPRLIGYRIPYNMDAHAKRAQAIPEGTFAPVRSLEDLQKEVETRYQFSKKSKPQQQQLAAALAGINPRLIPAGGVAAGLPPEKDRWRVEANSWQTAYMLQEGGPMLFPAANWLLTQKTYRPDVPEHVITNETPSHITFNLKAVGHLEENLILRLDLQGDDVLSAVAMKEASPHRIFSVIPLAMDEQGQVLGGQPGKAKPKKTKLDLDTFDLNSLGGPSLDPAPAQKLAAPTAANALFSQPWFEKNGKSLTGSGRLQLKTRKGESYWVDLHVDATQKGANWTGTFKARFPESARKKNSGRKTQGPTALTSRKLTQGGDSIAGTWTTPWGQDGRSVSEKRPQVTRDPGQAKLVWTSGHTIPIGRGPNTRGASRPHTVGAPLSGGWGSPVLADETVLLAYYRPSGNQYAYGASPRKDPLANQAMDMMRVHTDEYLHAFDSATGATRWKLQIKGRGVNWMGFNKGGPGTSAGVGDGIGLWLTTTGELFAADLKTGKLLWMNHIGLRHEQMVEAKRIQATGKTLYSSRNDFQSAVLITDGVVITSDHTFSKDSYRYEKQCGLVGFDLKTGRQLWHAPEIAGRSKFNQGGQLWEHGGKTYLLGSHNHGTAILDPKTGKILASADSLINRSWGLVSGDGMVVGEIWNDPENPKAGTRIAGFKLDPAKGFTQAWVLPETYTNRAGGGVYQDGHFYLSTGKSYDGLLCVNAKSGKVVAKHGIKMGGGEHAPFVISMGNVILGTIDRTHGLILFDADPSKLEGSAKVWHLDLATGYCGSVVPVISDGRMIIRSPDRLLCFDLRNTP